MENIKIEDYNLPLFYTDEVKGSYIQFWSNYENLKKYCIEKNIPIPKTAYGCKKESLELDFNYIYSELSNEYEQTIDDAEIDERAYEELKTFVNQFNEKLDKVYNHNWWSVDKNVNVIFEE